MSNINCNLYLYEIYEKISKPDNYIKIIWDKLLHNNLFYIHDIAAMSFSTYHIPTGHTTLLRRWINVNAFPLCTRRCCDVESTSMTLIQCRNCVPDKKSSDKNDRSSSAGSVTYYACVALNHSYTVLRTQRAVSAWLWSKQILALHGIITHDVFFGSITAEHSSVISTLCWFNVGPSSGIFMIYE